MSRSRQMEAVRHAEIEQGGARGRDPLQERQVRCPGGHDRDHLAGRCGGLGCRRRRGCGRDDRRRCVGRGYHNGARNCALRPVRKRGCHGQGCGSSQDPAHRARSPSCRGIVARRCANGEVGESVDAGSLRGLKRGAGSPETLPSHAADHEPSVAAVDRLAAGLLEPPQGRVLSRKSARVSHFACRRPESAVSRRTRALSIEESSLRASATINRENVSKAAVAALHALPTALWCSGKSRACRASPETTPSQLSKIASELGRAPPKLT